MFEEFVGVYEGEENGVVFFLAFFVFGQRSDQVFCSWLFNGGVFNSNCDSADS